MNFSELFKNVINFIQKKRPKLEYLFVNYISSDQTFNIRDLTWHAEIHPVILSGC